jgi:hypothetical protein
MRRVRALVLQHIACEPPASTRTSYASAERRSIASSSTRASPFPVGESSDVIVAMGGPMSVNDETENPCLVGEKSLIAEAVQAGVPFFGACLGAQLLAASLGAASTQELNPRSGRFPSLSRTRRLEIRSSQGFRARSSPSSGTPTRSTSRAGQSSWRPRPSIPIRSSAGDRGRTASSSTSRCRARSRRSGPTFRPTARRSNGCLAPVRWRS